ncbi:MAG: hypothetical protein AB1489_34010 [Acidobacteriota bacterium]
MVRLRLLRVLLCEVTSMLFQLQGNTLVIKQEKIDDGKENSAEYHRLTDTQQYDLAKNSLELVLRQQLENYRSVRKLLFLIEEAIAERSTMRQWQLTDTRMVEPIGLILSLNINIMRLIDPYKLDTLSEEEYKRLTD